MNIALEHCYFTVKIMNYPPTRLHSKTIRVSPIELHIEKHLGIIMNHEQDSTPSCAEDRRKQLRQLQHDIKTHLGIITMGLHALEGARNEPETFDEIIKMINSSGAEPLKEIVSEILKIACSD